MEELFPTQGRVVRDHTPSLQSQRPSRTTFIHPLTGEPVPLDALDEAVRVGLLDPAFKAQHSEQPRSGDSVDLEGNLRRFARHRSDLFDSSGDGERTSGQQRPAPQPWDGQVSTANHARKLAEGARRARAALLASEATIPGQAMASTFSRGARPAPGHHQPARATEATGLSSASSSGAIWRITAEQVGVAKKLGSIELCAARPKVSVGRGAANDLQLASLEISKRHAKLQAGRHPPTRPLRPPHWPCPNRM